MSKWKVYVLYFADADDPFDRCYCGKWRFQGVAYADGKDDAIKIVQEKKNIAPWEVRICHSCEGKEYKRRDFADMWRADSMSKRADILPCKCGKTPTLRYRMPFSWVECKCGRCSKAFVDGYEQVDPDAVKAAIADWNERFGRKDDVTDGNAET